MPSYKDRATVECTTCEASIRVMIPVHRHDWVGNAEAWVLDALVAHENAVHDHTRPTTSLVYPRATQPCVTCGALIADRDLNRHFQWHNK